MSTADLPTDLPPELREIADRQAVADLVSRLGLWLDAQHFDEAHAVFTDDVAVDTPGGASEGIDRVVAQARRNHEAHETQHVIANVLVDLVEPDRATVGANLVVTFAPRDGAPLFMLGERYAFDAVRTSGGWRLSRVHVRPLWRTGAPA